MLFLIWTKGNEELMFLRLSLNAWSEDSRIQIVRYTVFEDKGFGGVIKVYVDDLDSIRKIFAFVLHITNDCFSSFFIK